MNISRINIALKAALIIGLPFMFAACQGTKSLDQEDNDNKES